MSKEYKFAAEGIVVMYLAKYQILQQHELDFFTKNQNVFDENNQCNIYFILKRPRTTINTGYFINADKYFELEAKIQVQNTFTSRFLRIPKNEKFSKVELVSAYPYNYFSIVADGREFHFKTGVLLDALQREAPVKDDLLDYEVLYIGQSFGSDGSKNATNRIPSHSTLQKIYSEAIMHNPDSEIWLMLSSFSQKNVSHVNGRIKIKEENKELDEKRFAKFINSEFTDKQKINFTEAALIRTFRPKYNKEYKNTFPNPTHSEYSECYSLDLNGIVVEIDLSEKSRWLYSEHKARGNNSSNLMYWQHGEFNFINDKDRYSMFNNEYL